ncbi:hypothetical protein DUZ99_17640 [Xylanibacillus composti]|uniref:Uncharacterized protein n=1 Tax=Xylanibacillus composti TaxID=1572762 RepID=A0A8J4GXX6_9BACL|nr:hypothetical protein [Xylanibacillus composti]MDT9726804.1 hypothetical protein [Xylanibacillus composti]GIQ67213.1 hypothetical protein XYCOK13_00370 [Xylanibacillus composti]
MKRESEEAAGERERSSAELTDTERANIEMDRIFYGDPSQEADTDPFIDIDNAALRHRNQS